MARGQEIFRLPKETKSAMEDKQMKVAKIIF
jgi:hypothetical protein